MAPLRNHVPGQAQIGPGPKLCGPEWAPSPIGPRPNGPGRNGPRAKWAGPIAQMDRAHFGTMFSGGIHPQLIAGLLLVVVFCRFFLILFSPDPQTRFSCNSMIILCIKVEMKITQAYFEKHVYAVTSGLSLSGVEPFPITCVDEWEPCSPKMLKTRCVYNH